jgi:hypothetical protein
MITDRASSLLKPPLHLQDLSCALFLHSHNETVVVAITARSFPHSVGSSPIPMLFTATSFLQVAMDANMNP